MTPDGRSGQLWCRSTLSHNLVVVDEEEQASEGCGSDLELFGVAPGVEIVQACGVNVYPQCDTYRRTSALIRTPEGQAYFVDLFRVKGGKSHQYGFRCSGSLVRMDPEHQVPQPVELSEVWSEWVDNPRAVEPEAPCTFTWRSGDTNLDLALLNAGDTVDRIVIADAPGWRRAFLEEFEKPPIQQILAEHRAKHPGEALATQYAAVIVPYQGSDSPVRSARLLEDDGETGVIAIEVQFDDRTDIIISTQDQQSRQYGPVTAAGEFAFVSLDSDGRAAQGYLLKGTTLKCGDLQIELPEGSTTLPVRSVSDRTIHLDTPVPDGLAGVGTHLLARGPARRYGDHQAPHPWTGFEIESAGSDSITVRDYPVFDCDEVTLLNSRWLRLKP